MRIDADYARRLKNFRNRKRTKKKVKGAAGRQSPKTSKKTLEQDETLDLQDNE